MVQAQRVADCFLQLVRIDSPAREEQEIASFLKDRLEALGAEVFFDDADEATGGSVGNLIARFPGSVDVEPMLLSAHMDTVEPGRGVKPLFENGFFRSSGDTILGSDDKSGIAIILEVLQSLKDPSLPHGPIEVVFSVCEEIGLMGAKHLDKSCLQSRFGYVLDAWDIGKIVTRAPAANRFTFIIRGKESHAGAEPENGINAVVLAAKGIAACPDGRIDHETTCNIGRIEGGTATNIVPASAVVHAEARSHDPEKLKNLTRQMVDAFRQAVEMAVSGSAGLPSLEVSVEEDFPHTCIPEDAPVVLLAKRAAENLGRTMKTGSVGGGSDANIFFSHGIEACVIGTGMRDVHTVRENVALADMVACAELLVEMARVHAGREGSGS
ncbi:M20/M25/M40 family metallo-hydrolase [Desulfobotulus sp. H1]|uniref:M20/M25/M40 family metallo-hydrolase n=1 Tax=Desulfobotulus pelophilus TaxID=2823377 RepID=A0ABT3NCS7_9BACT|nr:M20/M25/M40 family metallo-hydrolase [Desulfobotulus pelophilus]MCW7755257.1 M20/M25/M40 family metallo-hydrolase [Desulfobotulus pelophilus]